MKKEEEKRDEKQLKEIFQNIFRAFGIQQLLQSKRAMLILSETPICFEDISFNHNFCMKTKLA